MSDKEWKPIHTRACEVVFEMEAQQKKYGLSDEQLYQAADDNTRKEYFVKMYQLLKEYTA
jgi:hypothetical protein